MSTPLVESLIEEEPVVAVEDDSSRRVGLFELVMIVYMLSCGGPFGIEAAVGAAGPLLTLIALVVVAVLWVAPQALVAAELSLMMQTNGGSLEWVDKAFGNALLSHLNACMALFSSLTSYALLVVLVSDYIPTGSILGQWLIKGATVLIAIIINVFGPDMVARFSFVLILIVFVPFLLQAAVASIEGDLFRGNLISDVLKVPRIVRWDVFLPTVTWCFGSFDAVGNLAGEVKGGRRTFLLGLATAFPLVFMSYAFPTIVGVAVEPEFGFETNSSWVAGGFSLIAAKQVAWLGYAMDVSGALSNLGQFCACVAAVARIAWFCSQSGNSKLLPRFFGISYRNEPVIAIISTSLFILGLTAISFDSMVQMFLFARVFNLVGVFASFVKMRFSAETSNRPFSAPGGRFVSVLYGIPTVVIGVHSLVFTDGFVWIVNGIVVAVSLAMFGVKMLWNRSDVAQLTEMKQKYHDIK